ncbi:HET-domain-containing protein [Mollisia scopiformis]|uniref:HET-domain-containing protein n=1 Tax=Mollisia scopiformis TaxID=149040 RepID=A0A194X0F7_MOLSC|nr:HET-domain-containing protein [Mollisia scopiformis]KUJ13434.1 HET-domain-containing protein [Mollisia scopiformis]
MVSSFYQHLNVMKSEIRLLEILQNTSNDAAYRLSTVSLDDSPNFTALSYVWGDAAVTDDIVVNDATVPVTVNLSSALKHVSKHWQKTFQDRNSNSFRLWVDALCINQLDIQERNEQVLLMRSIYTSAELVLGWLGPEDEKVPLALETLQMLEPEFGDPQDPTWDINKLCDFAWLNKYPGLNEDDPPLVHSLTEDKIWSALAENKVWSALDLFCHLPYWKRVWIVQEMVLAKRLLFISPSTSASLETFGVVCSVLLLITQELNKGHLSRPHFVSRSTWSVLSLPNGLQSKYAPIALSTMCRTMFISRKTATLEGCRIMNTMFARAGAIRGASNPKDHVYGTLGLSSLHIVPDYSSDKSVGDVYAEYVSAVMEGDRESGLFFLSEAGIGLFENDLKLPSWVPNYPEISQGTPSWRYSGNASFGTFGSDVPVTRISGRILSVAGVHMQTISRLGVSPTVEGLTDKQLLSFIRDFTSRHLKYATGIPALQAIYRVFTTSNTYEFNVPNLLHTYAFVHCLFNNVLMEHDDVEDIWRKLVAFGLPHLGQDAHFNILNTFFWHNDIGPDEIESTSARIGIPDSRELFLEEISNAKTQLSRDLSANTDRRLFETDSGYLGLAPEKAAEGDLVCILNGCEMVALLRKHGNNYLFVGLCFVLGLMDGEARAYLDAGRTKVKIFDIK